MKAIKMPLFRKHDVTKRNRQPSINHRLLSEVRSLMISESLERNHQCCSQNSKLQLEACLAICFKINSCSSARPKNLLRNYPPLMLKHASESTSHSIKVKLTIQRCFQDHLPWSMLGSKEESASVRRT